MFTDEERAIFPFDRNDGNGAVAGDPQQLFRELHRNLAGKSLGGEGGLLDAIQRGDSYVASDAAAVLYPAVRKTFGLTEPTLEGQGCTEAMCWRVLISFLAFLRKKSDTRTLSDMLSAYGGWLMKGRLDYATWFGLWLNCERVNLRRAWYTALGVGVANSRKPVSRNYFDASCPFEEEVDQAMSRANAARELAAMRGMK